MKKIITVAALFALAAFPACKKTQKADVCAATYEIEERVSGPAGWDIDEDQLNIK